MTALMVGVRSCGRCVVVVSRTERGQLVVKAWVRVKLAPGAHHEQKYAPMSNLKGMTIGRREMVLWLANVRRIDSVSRHQTCLFAKGAGSTLIGRISRPDDDQHCVTVSMFPPQYDVE